MSEVKRFDEYTCGVTEAENGEYVKHSDYAKLAAEAQALRKEVARSEQHRNDQADLIVSLRTEVAALRMARDDFKLERDLARQNFCDEQAANYQLQAHLKFCLGELAEPRARVVVVPERRPAPKGTWSDMGDAYNEGVNNTLDELARLNGLTVSESALDTLRRFATGKVMHLNNGLCPDDIDGHEARDPDCPVCRALIETGKESDNV